MAEKLELTDIGTGEYLGILNIADYIKCAICGGIDFNIYKMEETYFAMCKECHEEVKL